MNKATSLIILIFFFLFTFNFKIGVSKSDISIGYQMSLTVPGEYSQGFIGKAFLMESDKNKSFPPPKYRTALSVEATDYRYACSLDLFLGAVKVWSSGHRSKFYASDMCVLELTQHGDLRLKDSNDLIGWRTGTNDQGVQRLRLLETGNMVLVDSGESIKWQTFNFPTDVLLVGQRLSVATHLTSYPAISSSSWFYSLEIQHDKLGLYLNSGINSNTNRDNNSDKYSYWEFQPSKGRNITFVELTSHALLLFDDALTTFAQIPALTTVAGGLRFMALDNSTGNLGLYYYNPVQDEFKPSFEALNAACDLPLACSASNYTVCTRSGSCSCINHQRLQIKEANLNSDCDGGGDDFLSALDCGDGREEMVELEGVLTVLVSSMRTDDISKDECSELCLMGCKCKAALYGRQGRRECELYNVVSGVKETSGGEEAFMLKLRKRGNTKAGLRKWVLVVIVASDGILLLAMAAGLAYFFLWKRRRTTTSLSSADL
ncbi:hypothetical protein V2J09_010724 [Rumex salicifolius]